MSTKSKSHLAELEKLEAAVDTAEEKLSSVQRDEHAADTALVGMIGDAQQHLSRHPDQYQANGQPSAGTEAEKLHKAIEKAKAERPAPNQKSPVIMAAELELRKTTSARAEFVFENAEPLFSELAEEGERLATAVTDSLKQTAKACQDYLALEQQMLELLGGLPGAISGGDLRTDARVNDIRRTIKQLSGTELTGPRSHSLNPHPDHTPRFVLGPDGNGYIRAANAIQEAVA